MEYSCDNLSDHSISGQQHFWMAPLFTLQLAWLAAFWFLWRWEYLSWSLSFHFFENLNITALVQTQFLFALCDWRNILTNKTDNHTVTIMIIQRTFQKAMWSKIKGRVKTRNQLKSLLKWGLRRWLRLPASVVSNVQNKRWEKDECKASIYEA